MANTTPASAATTIPTSANRLVSLDILRGVTIAFMIMVNNNGGEQAWAQMHHAAWNGLTATDLAPSIALRGERRAVARPADK
jgi:predicted acyltransferase